MPLILAIAAFVLLTTIILIVNWQHIAGPLLLIYIAGAMNGCVPIPYHQDIAKMRARPQVAGCIQPVVPKRNWLVVSEVYEGDTLADVTVGPKERNQTVVRVHVGWGLAPITAVLIGRGVIWDFDGQTGRVERIFAITTLRDYPSAVRGLPAEKVTFPHPTGNCMFTHVNDYDAPAAARQETALTVMFGHKPDHITYQYEAEHIDLPSGRAHERSRNVAGGTDYYPGGILDLDPETLVAEATARDRPAYELKKALDGWNPPVQGRKLVLPPWPAHRSK